MKTIKFIGIFVALSSLLIIFVASAQENKVSGTVSVDKKHPIFGVSVKVKSTSKTTLTDFNGYYSIAAAKGDTLIFFCAGYETQKHKVTGDVLNIRMKLEVVKLEDMLIKEYQLEPDIDLENGIVMRVSECIAMPLGRVDMYYQGGEEYATFKENGFISVSRDPLSTFSLEADGASYSNVRRMINRGAFPDKDAIRVEEFINYFSYDYEKPKGNDPLKISYETNACPWNKKHRLVRIGVKAKEIPSEKLPATNFVFLIDVSGSMYGRLDLVKSSLKLLVNNLRESDRIAIVTYAGAAGEALPSTSGSDKQKIREALDNLTAGGSTAGGAGIKLAYKIARQNFMNDGNNRIILCTDGDFNVGVSSDEGLESLIEQERKSGVFLTVLGYGMGNYKDKKMQILAEKGNGNYAYIDNMQEANKVLVNEFGSTIYTVAKDVKVQVEFNPAKVQSYRLVGYESRLLNHEDFNNDTKDAGEIGAGHSVTVFYEVVPVGVKSEAAGTIDPLKYQPSKENPYLLNLGNDLPDLMTVKLRYKDPDGDTSKKLEVPIIDRTTNKLSGDFHFASAVAMFAQLLRDSDYKGCATYDMVLEEARKGLDNDEHGYRREFIRIAESAKGMANQIN